LDLQLPDGTGLELLPRLCEEWPDTPVVMMTAHGSVKSAVEAMRIGAYTYLQKPLDTSELQVVLQNAIETGRLRRQTADRADRKSRRFGFDSIIGKSTAMRRVLDQSRTVAESPASTVLLFGESGVGKGLVARAIHYASARASSPLLTVTCSAIPENLLEAELFGHEKGAFTDAKTQRRGVFEAADGGTVFLDEIGDMPPALQAKLLGVLEERSFHRIGSTETLRVDVRIVAATHRDLTNEVQQGRFREDLYYRLRVVPIVIPPLRERVADIILLARSFIQRFNSEFDRAVETLHDDAAELLKAHAWPGNVRELRNVVEHAMLFVKGDTLMPDNLLLEPGYHPHREAAPAAPAAGAAGDPFSLPAGGVKLEEVEEVLVRKALERSGGNKSHAAKLLGISRDQIRYRIEKMEAKK
jgi:DNA-binding NtrC family response regulator